MAEGSPGGCSLLFYIPLTSTPPHPKFYYLCGMFATPEDTRKEYIEKYEEPQHHVNALLGASIITLDIRPRLLFPLDRAGVKKVGDLLKHYRSGFAGVYSFGAGAAKEIENIIITAGLDKLR